MRNKERWAVHNSTARSLHDRACRLRADAEQLDAVADRVLRLGEKFPRMGAYSTFNTKLRVASATRDAVLLGDRVLVSPDANAVVDSFEIAVSVSGEVEAWVFRADVDGHVFSCPPAFVIGHSRRNLPHVSADGWAEKMELAGLPPAIIQKVGEAFLSENERISRQSWPTRFVPMVAPAVPNQVARPWREREYRLMPERKSKEK